MTERHDEDMPLSDEEMAQAKRGESLIAAAVADTQAPQSLRESIERERERAQRAPKAPFWRRRATALAAVGAAVAVLIAVVVGLQLGSGSDNAAPSLAEVQATAQLPATYPAPAEAGGDPPVLERRVGAIRFPDWQQKFSWRAVGSREDEVAGRTVKTVYYRNPEGAKLGYAIVDGAPLDEPPPGREVVRDGKRYHVADGPEHTVVTWNQQGHTCTIVASAAVPEEKLITLAASRNV